MGIGAISAAQPYVYNTNYLRVDSLKPISAVNNDVKTSHIGQTGSNNHCQETINPLGYGQTKNFADILGEQMQMSRNQADQLFGADSVFAE